MKDLVSINLIIQLGFLFFASIAFFGMIIYLVRETREAREAGLHSWITTASAMNGRINHLERKEQEVEIENRARLLAKKYRYDEWQRSQASNLSPTMDV